MSAQDLARWVELSDGVDTLSISFHEALNYIQSYENIGGHATFRTLDGTGVKQQNWSKLKTSVSGNGSTPSSLSGLDYSGAITLKCGAYRKAVSTSNVIVVPADRRGDAGYEPRGMKRVRGVFLPASISTTGNTATVEIDAEANAYSVVYYPEIIVLMNNPSEGFSVGNEETSWSFTAEQV